MCDCSAVVFDSFGVLEHILSFASPKDLVEATGVNQRWKEAGRSDILWKLACASFWKDRKGVCLPTKEEEVSVDCPLLCLVFYRDLPLLTIFV